MCGSTGQAISHLIPAYRGKKACLIVSEAPWLLARLGRSLPASRLERLPTSEDRPSSVTTFTSLSDRADDYVGIVASLQCLRSKRGSSAFARVHSKVSVSCERFDTRVMYIWISRCIVLTIKCNINLNSS